MEDGQKTKMRKNMAIIRSFRDLNVYQRERVEGSHVFKATKSFPSRGKILAYRPDQAFIPGGKNHGR